RHTRFSRDWRSDVCSSDLRPPQAPAPSSNRQSTNHMSCPRPATAAVTAATGFPPARSLWRADDFGGPGREAGIRRRSRYWAGCRLVPTRRPRGNAHPGERDLLTTAEEQTGQTRTRYSSRSDASSVSRWSEGEAGERRFERSAIRSSSLRQAVAQRRYSSSLPPHAAMNASTRESFGSLSWLSAVWNEVAEHRLPQFCCIFR